MLYCRDYVSHYSCAKVAIIIISEAFPLNFFKEKVKLALYGTYMKLLDASLLSGTIAAERLMESIMPM